MHSPTTKQHPAPDGRGAPTRRAPARTRARAYPTVKGKIFTSTICYLTFTRCKLQAKKKKKGRHQVAIFKQTALPMDWMQPQSYLLDNFPQQMSSEIEAQNILKQDVQEYPTDAGVAAFSRHTWEYQALVGAPTGWGILKRLRTLSRWPHYRFMRIVSYFIGLW